MAVKNAEICSKLSDIAILIKDSDRWAAAQPSTSLAAHLATYIDVYILGVLEESIELLLRERAHQAKDNCVANYVCQDINEKFRNPRRQSIGEVLKKFNPDFSDAFYARFAPNCSEVEALNSINDIKRNLAHMGAYDLKLTLQDVEEYFNRVIPILEEIESILS
jgi:RiboL-PSP-HEPN